VNDNFFFSHTGRGVIVTFPIDNKNCFSFSFFQTKQINLTDTMVSKTETAVYSIAVGAVVGFVLGWKFRGWALKKVTGAGN